MSLLYPIKLISKVVGTNHQRSLEYVGDSYCTLTIIRDGLPTKEYELEGYRKIKILFDASGSVQEFIEAIEKFYNYDTVFNLEYILKCPEPILIPYLRLALQKKKFNKDKLRSYARDVIRSYNSDCSELHNVIVVFLEQENVSINSLYKLATKIGYLETARIIKSYEIPDSKGYQMGEN